jgi:hypothetical protein
MWEGGRVLLVLGVDLFRKLFEKVQRVVERPSVALDDLLGRERLFDEDLGLLEELAGEEDHGGGAVSDLVVLGLGDVDQGLGGGVDHVQHLEDRGAVVGDDRVAVELDELVHSPGAWRGKVVLGKVPNVVLTISTMAWQALILAIIWALPWLVSVPSLSRRMLGL